jgi:hypothetical protein
MTGCRSWRRTWFAAAVPHTPTNRHVLTLDVAAVFEALAKSAQPVRDRVKQWRMDEPESSAASAARTRQAATPPSSVMNSRRFI